MNKINNTDITEKIAFEVSAAGGCAYFVGGCVRDKLLGIPSGDIDIEVHGIEPETLESILSSIGHTRTFGVSFGIWSLDGTDIDIAMPRLEEATGKGHKDFKTYINPHLGTEKASRRRDFTVNAIMENILTHELVDHYGGISDLKNRVLRHVNDESFAEDPLRVLRGAGFAARFGFKIADETLALFERMPLEELSCERVFAELEKALLKAVKPSYFFDVLRKCDKLDTWFPEIKALIGVPQSQVYHAEGDVYNHTMLVLDEAAKLRSQAKNPLYFMLSALCHDLGKTVTTAEIDGKIRSFNHEIEGLAIATSLIDRLTHERELKKYVLNMIKLHMRPNMLTSQNASKKAYNRLLDESLEPHDLLLLSKADFYGSVSFEKKPYKSTEAILRSALDEYNRLMSLPYVTGADLIAAGLTPGEDFTRLLDFAHKLRLSGLPKKQALAQVLAQAQRS